MLSFLLDFVLHLPCLFKDGFPQKSHKKKGRLFLRWSQHWGNDWPNLTGTFFFEGLGKKNTNYRYGADIQFELRWDVLEVVFLEVVFCWFGLAVWIFWFPLMERDCYLEVPQFESKNHRAPNHQLAITWLEAALTNDCHLFFRRLP